MLQENFVQYIEEAIRDNQAMPTLSDYRGESFTYREVGDHILRLHEYYKAMNIHEGDKIALIGRSSSKWAITYMATVCYGCTIVPLLPDFTPEDLQQLVNHSDSVLLFCEDAIFEKLDVTGMSLLKAVISVNSFSVLHAADQANEISIENNLPSQVDATSFSLPAIGNEQLAVISYTSGTTGSVKGVMLLHNSLAANVKYARENMPLKTGDKIVSFLPMAHAFGCAFELLFPFSLGCHITVLTKSPSPQVILQAFSEIQPALILSVPLVIEKIYKNKIIPVLKQKKIQWMTRVPILKGLVYKKMNRSLTDAFGGKFKALVVGGAPFSEEVESFLKKIKFRFTVGYGMTECGPLISYMPWEVFKPRSSGKLIDTLEGKILSDKPAEIPGEIMVRGEGVMVGYYKNEVLTAEIIEPDGWMHTGDLGTMDNDGTLYIKGRSKTMLLSANGQNIYPDELESLLNNMHGVAESLVIQRNARLIALIYPDEQIVAKENLTPEALQKLFKQHLNTLNRKVAKYMQVADFEIQEEEFVKTPKKSIRRFLYH